MGCGSCGTSKTGSLPTGCKDHGSCKSGGCNRLNVHCLLYTSVYVFINSLCITLHYESPTSQYEFNYFHLALPFPLQWK